MTQPNPPQVADILNAAADLLEKPGAWTQGCLARDHAGQPSDWGADNPRVACRCLVGAVSAAIVKLRPGHFAVSYTPVIRVVEDVLGRHPAGWNDDPTRTQAEVVATLREAARLSRTQAPTQ